MANDNRYLMVHGHFYQPPRENPWTGHIEPQPSAAPWPDWNSRIAAECYLPMARSRVWGNSGDIVDLANNYISTSFNFGPTLLSWFADEVPEMLDHLRDALAENPSAGLAQAYSHPMLPLGDVRDRHTQILWGLAEFEHRFGFRPKGMWLSECGIDKETVRALIDHDVRFVILSPHQASKARPFGEPEWRDASMGSIDTRRAYRLFDTDGGGRTHFDRWLDVIFYTPGLNIKVSFDHILNRPAELAEELESCYDPNRLEAQLVSIVTDGEIYGHHEKNGEEALTRLFRKIAPSLGLTAVTAGDFVRLHPPAWEVKLWDGEDGNGTSWSCQHGMGRWSRDCGCSSGGGAGWNQSWRAPLRDAFDRLRDQIRETCRRVLGPLVWDVIDARNDYIRLVLDPGREARQRFLDRHSQRRLSADEQGALWRLLEADRHAMLMYTSCGWFFDELSGLEPVQNMLYALRAAELAAPCREDDPVHGLAESLRPAKSNLPRYRDGEDVFRSLAMPRRYDDRELAAAVAMCLALDTGTGTIAWRPVALGPTERRESAGRRTAWGAFVCHDPILDRYIRASWFADLTDLDAAGVFIHDLTAWPADSVAPADEKAIPAPTPDAGWIREINVMPQGRLFETMRRSGVPGCRLPPAAREPLYRRFAASGEAALMQKAITLGWEASDHLRRARRFGAETPKSVLAGAVLAVERSIAGTVHAAIASRVFDDAAVAKIKLVRKTAEELDFWASQDRPARALAFTMREILYWLGRLDEPGWLANQRALPLPDGEEWVAPASPANRRLTQPQAGRFASSLGKGLASWRRQLLDAADPARAAFHNHQLADILAFAKRGGFALPKDAGVEREFWDFLAAPLERIIKPDPTGLITGPAGERLLHIAGELGFSEDAINKRLLTSAKSAMASGDSP